MIKVLPERELNLACVAALKWRRYTHIESLWRVNHELVERLGVPYGAKDEQLHFHDREDWFMLLFRTIVTDEKLFKVYVRKLRKITKELASMRIILDAPVNFKSQACLEILNG